MPTNSLSINNNNLVGNAINPLTYTGFRVSALYKINSDWNALLTQSYQNMDSEGVFNEMPYGTEGAQLNSNAEPIGGQPLPPLSVNCSTRRTTRTSSKTRPWSSMGRSAT